MTMEEIVLDDEVKPPTDFNIFVGAETGLLKGVCLNPKMNLAKNFSNMHTLERKHEITAMAWGNEEQAEVLLGLKGRIVRTFDPEDKSFTSSHEMTDASGKIVGIARAQDALVVASETGVVQVWRDPKDSFNTIDFELSCSGKLKANSFKDEEAREKHMVTMKADRSLARMRKVPKSSSLIATGGKENDLQIWDLEKIPSGPVFRAKNVPMDSLELRVPIWITDMCFPDNCSKDKVATVTRYGHVRLYDTKGNQRRPVMNLDWPEQVLTTISSTPDENSILVGTSSGHIAQFDLRMTHKGMKNKFRGCTGGIRSIDCHPVHKTFAAVGLDRFLRIYDINQAKPIQKMYLKSKLNHVLLAKDFDPATAIAKIEKPDKSKSKKKPAAIDPDIIEVDQKGGEEFWKKLPIVRSSSTKKGKRPQQTDQAVSAKKKSRK